MKVLVWQYLDGGQIAVRELSEHMRLPDESDDAFAARIRNKTVLAGPPLLNALELPADYAARIAGLPHQGKAVFVGVRNKADLPPDRTFRNAWKPDFSIDMEKARDIHRGKLRELRAPKLAVLDVEYQRADEIGDVARKREIAARKQVLRDITKDERITNAKTPEELIAVLPEILKDQL